MLRRETRPWRWVPLAVLVAVVPVIADETRRVEGLEFTRVVLAGTGEVEISQGETYELQLRGDARDLDDEPFQLGPDGLVLGKSRRNSSRNYPDVRFRVVMPELHEVRVDGAGEVYVREFTRDAGGDGETGVVRFEVDGAGDLRLFGIDAPEVELRVKGSGDLKAVRVFADTIEAVVSGSGDLYIGEVRADRGEFVVTGSGDLEVTEPGFVRDLEVSVIGSGDAGLDDVASEVAEANIVGSGTATIGACSSLLEASILGSGDVRYAGEPEIEATSFGSGEIRQRR